MQNAPCGRVAKHETRRLLDHVGQEIRPNETRHRYLCGRPWNATQQHQQRQQHEIQQLKKQHNNDSINTPTIFCEDLSLFSFSSFDK